MVTSILKRPVFQIFFWFSLACMVALVLYWPGLHGGFFFDDEANILLAEGIRLESFSLEAIQAALNSGHAGISGRPVSQFSFALNYMVSGLDPFPYKATNLGIHILNTLFVLLLARRLLQQTGYSSKWLTSAPFLLATLWLLHPIQLTSVLLVVQRMTSLSALFLLSALLLHIHSREQPKRTKIGYLLTAWLFFWPLSFLSKESGVLFPLFALAWELIIRRSTHGYLDRFSWYFSAATALLALTTLAYSISPAGHWLWSGYEFRIFNLYERLLTETRVLWFYLSLLVFPRLETLGLYHDDFSVSQGLLSPWTTLPAIIGLLALTLFSWRLRKTAPLVSFGLIWFLIGHSLESTALPLELVHEHRNYLPLFGMLLSGVAATNALLLKPGWRKTICISIYTLLLLYFPLVTALRSLQFSQDIRRTQIEAQHHMKSARAQYEAGKTLAERLSSSDRDAPIHTFARRHFERSMELDKSSKMGALGLIYMNCLINEKADSQWVEELSRRLENTISPPGDTAIFFTLKEWAINKQLCLSRPDIEQIFNAALHNPHISNTAKSKIHSWHADYLWLHAGDLAGAQKALGKSLAIAPANPSNRLKWAQLLYISGDLIKANALLKEIHNENFSAAERRTLESLLQATSTER